LIVGGSLSGYVALRVAGPNRAIPLLGVLGGIVSSTATTLLCSRQVRSDAMTVPVAAMVILIANTVVLVRVCLIAAVVSTSVLPQLLPVLGVGVMEFSGCFRRICREPMCAARRKTPRITCRPFIHSENG
ncbi:MAG: DUF4010 domain-containing protein, partial [Panacagrimonas sp.]